MEISHEAEWDNVEKAYIYLNIYSGILMSYMKYMIGPAIVNVAAGIVVVLCVTRPSGLHAMIYCRLPLVCGVAMSLILWVSYDCQVPGR